MHVKHTLDLSLSLSLSLCDTHTETYTTYHPMEMRIT